MTETPAARSRTRKKKVSPTQSNTSSSAPAHTPKTNLYVLDTNVLLHDPSSITKFDEHDLFLPLITLEELDNHKTGHSEVARNARSFTRTIDELIQGQPDVANGFLLPCARGTNCGKLYFQDKVLSSNVIEALPSTKADNKILEVVDALRVLHPDRKVVLVSKDINIRLKAKALGLLAEDFKNDHAIDDSDILHKGFDVMDKKFMHKYGRHMTCWEYDRRTFYQFKGRDLPEFHLNHIIVVDNLTLRVEHSTKTQLVGVLISSLLRDNKQVCGISAKNEEQQVALSLLMDPDVDFVSLLGPAGTGKTLLALAAAIQQTIVRKTYSEIIVTRATVPVGEEIGFLPGTEEEKMAPWMGAFEDNLEFLTGVSGGGEDRKKLNLEEVRTKLKIKSMSFMRGRTFIKKFLIVDEAQNMTPKQMKTLITRAGSGTKVVCLGNLSQIDTPYLNEASSGLTHVVRQFRTFAHGGHVILQKGERSRLADFANENL